MWAKGSEITQVVNPRGTNKNLVFCKEQLLKGFDNSAKKVRALYSFVIACLPHIQVTKDLETSKISDMNLYLKLLDEHSDLAIVVWFVRHLNFEFMAGMKEWAEKSSQDFGLKVSAGDLTPETSLKKVGDIISRMSAWKEAGLSDDFLMNVAGKIKKNLAYEIAKGFDSNLRVRIRSYSEMTV
jgi:hypothetical protein